MNLCRVIPITLAIVSLAAGAHAQTATTPLPAPRPVVAASAVPPVVAGPSTGAASAVAPVARPAIAASAGVSTIGEQAPPAPPTPPAAPPAPQAPRAPRAATTGEAPTLGVPIPPRSRGQLVNLRLEFTVTDQIGSAPPVRKTITMNVADGESGRIRTNAEVFRKNTSPTIVPLSVDAYPEIEGSKIRLRASLEYQLLKEAPEPDMPAGKTSITQSVTAILNDGVSAVLSQSADPLTDRKVTLEVKATIIK
jgi:hypothetical protein